MPYNLFASGKFDSLNPYMIFAVTGALIAALGAAFSLPLPTAICLIGMGNSIFHIRIYSITLTGFL